MSEPTIRETPVRTVRLDAICGCGGVLEWKDGVQRGPVTFYIHFCSECGKQVTLTTGYPRIKHVEEKP